VLHRTPTKADEREEKRAGSRNVFFMRALMSAAVVAGSCARAPRELQRGVEVMSNSAAREMEIEGKKSRKSNGPRNTIGEIIGETILSKGSMVK